MSKGKIAIIGSGLGGLACGAILSRNGYEVSVYEKESQVGGCLQCFKRRGVKFETGMHFIGSADPGQILDRLMRYLGIRERVPLSRLDPAGYDVIGLGDESFRFAQGEEGFIETLAADFPREKDALARYYALIEKVSQSSPLHSLNVEKADAAFTTAFQLRSINEVVDSIIKDPKLAKVVVGNLPLYAGEEDKTPFSTHAFIMDFYNNSAFRVAGGSDKIANALKEVIEERGGKVITNSPVTKILCTDSKAEGIEIGGEEMVKADYVISAIHPKRTLELTESHLIRPVFRRRISSLPQTVGSFTVYLQYKKGKVPYRNSNYYGYTDGTPWGCEKYSAETWPKGYLYMHLCHEAGAEFAECGEILSYMRMDDVSAWLGTGVGRRGESYERFKEEKAQKLLEVVSRQFPEVLDSVEHYYTSTPLTYLDYTGTEEGSMYGIAKDITASTSYRIPQRTKVPNLLLSGQNINSHGMLGVIVGAIVTCSEFIPEQTIYDQINESR